MLVEAVWALLDSHGRPGGRGDAQLALRANFGTVVTATTFGVEASPLPHTPPWIGEHLTREQAAATLAQLDPATAPQRGLAAVALDRSAYLCDMLGDKAQVFSANNQSPLDIAHQIRGEDLYYDMYDDPPFVHDLLAACTAAYIAVAHAFKRVLDEPLDSSRDGVSYRQGCGVHAADDTATVLVPDLFAEFALPYDCLALTPFGGGSSHFCGQAGHILDGYLAAQEVRAINFGQPHLYEQEKTAARLADAGKVYFGSWPVADGESLESYMLRVLGPPGSPPRPQLNRFARPRVRHPARATGRTLVRVSAQRLLSWYTVGMAIRVTVWNEFHHEQTNDFIRNIYPNGIHEQIAGYLRQQPGLEVRTATLAEPEHGLTEEVLAATDVLMWWGHAKHTEVEEAIVDRVQARVLESMGLVVMHSGHFSKVFKRLMGTSCGLSWRESAERERLWVVNPHHPITQGCGRYIEIPNAEMYGEHFDIPDPDELLFVSWFEGGEVFRSGAVWHRGRGKIFYFRPGHETYPIYHHEGVLHVLDNGVRWCAFAGNTETIGIGRGVHITEPIETLSPKDYVQGEMEHPDL
jgi:trehalose utilization protein